MELTVPGDKSISQRALILAALAEGESLLRGLLASEDVASTAGALRALGVEIPPLSRGDVPVLIRGQGPKRLLAPAAPLDLGNSGTGARLLMGVLAALDMEAVITGDASLRRRPMDRVVRPLTSMGASVAALEAEGRLPMRIRGGRLRDLSYHTPVASAQVKSSLLLAGLVAGVRVEVIEPRRSRDHTERLLRSLGVGVEEGPAGEGWRVALTHPPERISPLDLRIPGDFSSAAFLLVMGLLRPEGTLTALRGVGLNPTRIGALSVLERMGGRIEVLPSGRASGAGEPVGDLVVRGSHLRGCEVEPEEIPSLIDEVPVLAVAAAQAEGETTITGARELRVKESDRIRALAVNLSAIGVEVRELEDGLVIRGTRRALQGTIDSFGDHRIAMAFGILGALPGNRIRIRGAEAAAVSFPEFWRVLESLGSGERAPARPDRGESGGGGDPSGSSSVRPAAVAPEARRPPVITLDGPAGSGKSTTARELARRLGFRHLDSGALYRALTVALLESGIPEEDWPNLPPEVFDRFQIRLKPAGARFDVLLGDRILEAELRTSEVTRRVSPLSALPAVRQWLLGAQREAAAEGGLVADGRDMGTVVFPDADLKVFLTADLEERARRRFLEREGRSPSPAELREEAARIRSRDERDEGRALAPLRKPPGALVVDTSHLTFDEQVQLILDHVKKLDVEKSSG